LTKAFEFSVTFVEHRFWSRFFTSVYFSSIPWRSRRFLRLRFFFSLFDSLRPQPTAPFDPERGTSCIVQFSMLVPSPPTCPFFAHYLVCFLLVLAKYLSTSLAFFLQTLSQSKFPWFQKATPGCVSPFFTNDSPIIFTL